MNLEKLKYLSSKVCDNIEVFLETLNIDCRLGDSSVVGCCPIHRGDNPNAWRLYYSDDRKGFWKCFTHQCHVKYGVSLVGLVAGIKQCSKPDAFKFLEEFTNCPEDFKQSEHYSFVRDTKMFQKKEVSIPKINLTKEEIRSRLSIPSKYFLKRNFSSEILNAYDVGDCFTPKKSFYGRAVVPIYDENNNCIGASARSTFDLCKLCKGYHIGYSHKCPKDPWNYSKWRHSKNSSFGSVLYNFNRAKSHIHKSGSIIIVEGPGDVWRLEEAGITNGVAICGSSISEAQILILECAGVSNLILATDNDTAGKSFKELLKKRLCRCYNLYDIDLPTHDVGDMSIKQVIEVFSKYQ